MNTISQQYILIQDTKLAYTLERKTVKNINLRIRHNGTLHVSATPRVPLAHIEAFLHKKGALILKTLAEIKERQSAPFLTLRCGDKLLLAGKPYTLDVRLGMRSAIRRSGQTVYMEVSENTPEQRLRLYHELLRREGEPLFSASAGRIVPKLAPYRIDMPKLRQRIMRSRWGSCMPLKKIVTMNTYLAVMPEPIIDQVMLHELCHLIHPNHSRHFYNVMTMIMPDWKERRAAMTAYLPYCL